MNRTALLLLGLIAALFFLSLAVPAVRAEDADDGDDGDAPAATESTGESEKDATREDETKPDGEDIDEDDTDLLGPSADIVTTVLFPEYPNRKFPIGNDISVLVGVQNKGKVDYNFTFIAASLHSPFDLSYYIQNYSARGIEQTVGAGKEATFDYTFRPDQRLEPLEFWLSAFMIYNNTETDRPHRTFFFNSTIELIEKPSDMNFRRVFTYFLAFAAAGLVGYVAFQISSPKGSKEERGTKADGESAKGSGWDVSAYKQARTSRAVGAKKAKGGPASPKA